MQNNREIRLLIRKAQQVVSSTAIGLLLLIAVPASFGQSVKPKIQSLNINSDDQSILAKAQELFEAGDTVGAIEKWNIVILKQADNPLALFNRAQAYIVLERYALALADLNALKELRDGQQKPNEILLEGVAQAALGQQDSAMKKFNLAWEKGRLVLALTNKAVLLKAMGNRDEAYELTKQIAIIEPSPANYYSLAALHRDNKHYEACRQVTSLILESNPAHVPSYLLRGICAYEQKQYGKALVDLLQSHSLAPAQAEQFIYIGKILMKQGKTDEATAWLLRGASLYLVQGKTVEQQEALKLAGGKGQ